MHADVPEFQVEQKTISGVPDYFFNPKIMRAREYASIVHEGQRYGNYEYTKHLEDVYKVFLEFIIEPVYRGKPAIKGVIDKYEDLACAIWLHDAVEDTSTTIDEIEEHFGKETAEMVDAVSGVGKNRQEKLDCVARKIEERPDAIMIKLCDRIANTRFSSNQYFSEDQGKAMFTMYVDEYPRFKQALGGIYKELGFIKKMWEYLESISKE